MIPEPMLSRPRNSPITKPPQKLAWPIIIGIIGITFALWQLFGRPSPFIRDYLIQTISDRPIDDILGFGGMTERRQHLTIRLVLSIPPLHLLKWAPLVILLVGSILLIMKKGIAVRCLKIWAATILTVALVNAIFIYIAYLSPLLKEKARLATMTIDQQVQEVAANTNLESSLIFFGFSPTIGIIYFLTPVVTHSLFPIFLLYWFQRKAIKEEISLWNNQKGND